VVDPAEFLLTSTCQFIERKNDMINLTKGQKIDLTKANPSLKKILAGLQWDERTTDGVEWDLDGSVFLLGDDGKLLSDKHFIFFNETTSPDGAVVHGGDNKNGAGEGDDETVRIDLSALDAAVKKIAIAITIHDAAARGQNFGQVKNPKIIVRNEETGEEIATYDLAEDASTETAVIMGEFYLHNGEWKFSAVGQGFAGGLQPLVQHFGGNA
jgi:tellurium resistance protein TerD